MNPLDAETSWRLRKASWVYPQPVAAACARVIRARNEQEQVDAILKCAEVITRYLASTLLASYAARQEDAQTVDLPPLKGPIAFGVFLGVVQQLAAGCSFEHPLKKHIQKAFRSRTVSKRKEPGPADRILTGFLELRNTLGHDIGSLTKARARLLIENEKLPAGLCDLLDAVDTVLSFPLFVPEDQRIGKKKRIILRRLLFMGASSDPEPEEVGVTEALDHTEAVYLGLPGGAILIDPFLLWHAAEDTKDFRIYVFDTVKDSSILYKNAFSSPFVAGPEHHERFSSLVAGQQSSVEPCTLDSGKTLVAEWRSRRRKIEDSRGAESGNVPWASYDPGTLRWYAERLDPEAGPGKQPQQIIAERLLDGQDDISSRELRELGLLFGNSKAVRGSLRRDLLDLRAKSSADERWTDRVELAESIICCLKSAVEFFGKHVGIDGVTLDGLSATSGSADYIAMREALVNLFIHQDYSDPTAVSSVEILPDCTRFFNAGFSLVDGDSLLEGGKSQARNPLIARALKLIGFAELAGSGLNEIARAWRKAERRPPVHRSDRKANTFCLVLDWRQLVKVHDDFWRKQTGVVITKDQARILNVIAGQDSLPFGAVVSGCGRRAEDVRQDIGYLLRQQMLRESAEDCYGLPDHFRDLLRGK